MILIARPVVKEDVSQTGAYNGSNHDIPGYSIRELVETLRRFIDFNYEFDATKPSGYPKRVMDISLARELIGYNPTTSLEEGLKETWHWFIEHPDEHLNKMNYFKE